MFVKKVILKNFKTHEDKTFVFNHKTEVYGENAVGKTSIIEAIRFPIYGSTRDVDKITVGKTSCSVTCEFEHETQGNIFIRADLKIGDDGKPVMTHQIRNEGTRKNITWLRSLLDLNYFDPRTLVEKDGRTQRLLNLMPIKIGDDEIKHLVPPDVTVSCKGRHAFEVIKELRGLMANERRYLYRQSKSKEKAFVEFEDNYKASVTTFERENGSINKVPQSEDLNKQITDIQAKNQSYEQIRQKSQEALNDVIERNNKIVQKINKLNQEMVNLEEERKKVSMRLAEIDALQGSNKQGQEGLYKDLEEIKKETEQKQNEFNKVEQQTSDKEVLAKLKEQLAIAQSAESILRQQGILKKMNTEFSDAHTALKAMDKKIHTDLKNLTSELLQPITEAVDGLTIDEDEIKYHHKSIDELSESETQLLALKLAQIQNPKALLLLDGVESIDDIRLENIDWKDLSVVLVNVGSEPRTGNDFKKIHLS